MVDGYLAIKFAQAYMLKKDTLTALKKLLNEFRNRDTNVDKIKGLSRQCASKLYKEHEIKKMITDISNSLNIKEITRGARKYKTLRYQFLNKEYSYQYFQAPSLDDKVLNKLRIEMKEQLSEIFLKQ